MNRIVKTSCVSGLADEIGRLKKKSDKVYDELAELLGIRRKINMEISLLQEALNRICDTEEDV